VFQFRASNTDALKALRITMKTVDAEFKRDVKARNETHKSAIVCKCALIAIFFVDFIMDGSCGFYRKRFKWNCPSW
jgi:hypothetical protein